jgi:hypothetical protein
MLDKTYKIETKHQQFLNKEAKRRFDEVWSTKTIAKQGDTFHLTIWVGLLPSSYVAPFCGLMPLVWCHNMKITMAKRKAKQMKVESNNL